MSHNFFIYLTWLVLIVISYTDIRYRTISNQFILVTMGLMLLNALWGTNQFDYIAAIIFLLIGIVIFYLNVIGAGDIKLISVLILSIPINKVIDFLTLIALCGIPLILVAIIYKSVFKKNCITLPYGVAISLGYMLSFKAICY